MDIFAFKWRMFPGKSAKLGLGFGAAAVLFLLYLTASLGAFIKQSVAQMADGNESKENFLLFLKLFIDNNADMIIGGVFWAMILSAIVMPLIGFSFGSIVPEGDLVSIKRNDNHKISDSIFLQMGSSISLVQALTLTALISLINVDNDRPGLAIIAGWGIWLISSLIGALSIWTSEFFTRKYGVKSKGISLGLLAAILAICLLVSFDNTLMFFGGATAFYNFTNSLTFENLPLFFGWIGGVAVVAAVLLALISFIAAKALNLPEPPARRDVNSTLLSRIGLEKKFFVSNVSYFITSNILQQPNILKPLLIGFGFTIFASVASGELASVVVLIPAMIALSWTINVFGIFGSGTTWLLSLPKAKSQMLSAIFRVHHLLALGMAVVTGLAVGLVRGISFEDFATFVMAVMAASIMIAHMSVRQSIYSPYRFRVNIKGESIIPPTKVIVSLFKLFFFGFLGMMLIYAAGQSPVTPTLMQVGVLAIISLVAYEKYRKLKREWMNNNVVIQNIIKSVGV